MSAALQAPPPWQLYLHTLRVTTGLIRVLGVRLRVSSSALAPGGGWCLSRHGSVGPPAGAPDLPLQPPTCMMLMKSGRKRRLRELYRLTAESKAEICSEQGMISLVLFMSWLIGDRGVAGIELYRGVLAYQNEIVAREPQWHATVPLMWV